MSFQPRCRLPFGLTVTRVTPAGDRTWAGSGSPRSGRCCRSLFDVDAEGKVRFERQPLPSAVDAAESRLALADFAEMGKVGVHPEVVLQSLLASAAFPAGLPVARALRVRRPTAVRTPRRPTASAPDPQGTPLTGLSCQAQSAAQGGRAAEDLPAPLRRRRRLRQRSGGARAGAVRGVLPAGGAEAADRLCSSTPTIGGSSRRSGPRTSTGAFAGAGALLTFAGDLVQTARNRELARAAQAGRWNLTTRRLLSDQLRTDPRVRCAPRRAPGPGWPAPEHGASSGAPRDRGRASPARPHPSRAAWSGWHPGRWIAASEALARQCAGFLRGEPVTDPLDLGPRAAGPGRRAAVARQSWSS